MRRLPKAVLMGVAAAAAAAPAGWAASPNFAIRPVRYRPSVPASQSYFIFSARPGATIRTEVRVTNVGSVAGAVLLYPVDATTGQTSGAVYRERGAPRRDVGAWIGLGAGRLTLAPKESRIVPVEIAVPRRARPGQHLGGLVAENLTLDQGPTASRGKGSFRLRIRHLSIVAVSLTLPGPLREAVSVGAVRAATVAGAPALLVGLRNTGTAISRPRLALTVVSGDGAVVEREHAVLDIVLPQTEIAFPVVLRRRALAAGRYSAEVELRYGASRTIAAERSFSVSAAQARSQYFGAPPPAASAPPERRTSSPLPWILAALGGFVGLGGAALALRSRRSSG